MNRHLNVIILHDSSLACIADYERELKKYNNNKIDVKFSFSDNIKLNFDKEIYDAKFVVFFLSKKNIFTNELILANTLGKTCIYVFLDAQLDDIVRKRLDQFKLLFEKSLKFKLYDKNYDSYLIDCIYDLIYEKTKCKQESTDSSDDCYDEKPFRSGSKNVKTKCTHGVRCWCLNSNKMPHFWR